MFPYVIRWDDELRAEVAAVKRRGAFRGYLWFDPAPVVAVPQPELTSEERLDELEWLLDNGMSPWLAAEALGRSLGVLERLAYRHGRRLLAQRVGKAA